MFRWLKDLIYGAIVAPFVPNPKTDEAMKPLPPGKPETAND